MVASRLTHAELASIQEISGILVSCVFSPYMDKLTISKNKKREVINELKTALEHLQEKISSCAVDLMRVCMNYSIQIVPPSTDKKRPMQKGEQTVCEKSFLMVSLCALSIIQPMVWEAIASSQDRWQKIYDKLSDSRKKLLIVSGATSFIEGYDNHDDETNSFCMKRYNRPNAGTIAAVDNKPLGGNKAMKLEDIEKYIANMKRLGLTKEVVSEGLSSNHIHPTKKMTPALLSSFRHSPTFTSVKAPLTPIPSLPPSLIKTVKHSSKRSRSTAQEQYDRLVTRIECDGSVTDPDKELPADDVSRQVSYDECEEGNEAAVTNGISIADVPSGVGHSHTASETEEGIAGPSELTTSRVLNFPLLRSSDAVPSSFSFDAMEQAPTIDANAMLTSRLKALGPKSRFKSAQTRGATGLLSSSTGMRPSATGETVSSAAAAISALIKSYSVSGQKSTLDISETPFQSKVTPSRTISDCTPSDSCGAANGIVTPSTCSSLVSAGGVIATPVLTSKNYGLCLSEYQVDDLVRAACGEPSIEEENNNRLNLQRQKDEEARGLTPERYDADSSYVHSTIIPTSDSRISEYLTKVSSAINGAKSFGSKPQRGRNNDDDDTSDTSDEDVDECQSQYVPVHPSSINWGAVQQAMGSMRCRGPAVDAIRGQKVDESRTPIEENVFQSYYKSFFVPLHQPRKDTVGCFVCQGLDDTSNGHTSCKKNQVNKASRVKLSSSDDPNDQDNDTTRSTIDCEQDEGLIKCNRCCRYIHPRCIYPPQRDILGTTFYCHGCRVACHQDVHKCKFPPKTASIYGSVSQSQYTQTQTLSSPSSVLQKSQSTWLNSQLTNSGEVSCSASAGFTDSFSANAVIMSLDMEVTPSTHDLAIESALKEVKNALSKGSLMKGVLR